MGRPKKVIESAITVVEPKEVDMLARLATMTGNITAKTVESWQVLTTGAIPEEHLKERPGYPKPVKYLSHVYGQRLLNEAFRWNWDFECLSYQVHEDGSVSSITRLTIHYPIGINKLTGNPIWKDRIITEIGSMEAYEKKAGGFTLSTADRVASSVSRGLVKCLERGFNLGSDLKEVEEEVTPLQAWNTLLRFGKKQGLERETIINLIKEKGITQETLIDRFQEAYTLVYEKAKGGEVSVPLEK